MKIFPTSQSRSAIQDKIIPAITINKEDGIIGEKINADAKINNKEANEAK